MRREEGNKENSSEALTKQYGDSRAFNERLYDLRCGLDVGDFSGADFFLGDAARLGGLGGDQSVGAALNLAGAAGGD